MTAEGLRLDADSPVAPYEQIRAQLASRIADGTLVAGVRLPTVRALADELGVAVNTAARVYRELETAGLVETRGRAGTVVSARGDAGRTRLQNAATRYADLARETGVAGDEALAIVRAALTDRP